MIAVVDWLEVLFWVIIALTAFVFIALLVISRYDDDWDEEDDEAYYDDDW